MNATTIDNYEKCCGNCGITQHISKFIPGKKACKGCRKSAEERIKDQKLEAERKAKNPELYIKPANLKAEEMRKRKAAIDKAEMIKEDMALDKYFDL